MYMSRNLIIMALLCSILYRGRKQVRENKKFGSKTGLSGVGQGAGAG